MNNEQLLARIERLEAVIRSMESSYTFPFRIQQALVARGFIRTEGPKSGIVKANGLAPATTVTGVGGDFFVANTSGGAVVREVIVTDGIVTT